MRGKQSGVTSDAMSGPYGTATGAITLEDTTETTRVTQYSELHCSPNTLRSAFNKSAREAAQIASQGNTCCPWHYMRSKRIAPVRSDRVGRLARRSST